MGKGRATKSNPQYSKDAGPLGESLLVECPDGDFDFIEPDNVRLCSEYVEARDLDGSRVQIPYAKIAGVTVDLP